MSNPERPIHEYTPPYNNHPTHDKAIVYYLDNGKFASIEVDTLDGVVSIPEELNNCLIVAIQVQMSE